MVEIIKIAIEGGYREDIVQIHKNMCSCGGDINHIVEDFGSVEPNYDALLLDKLFWQALEKECGWVCNCNDHKYTWLHYALRTLEIILTEGMDKGIEYLKSIVVK